MFARSNTSDLGFGYGQQQFSQPPLMNDPSFGANNQMSGFGAGPPKTIDQILAVMSKQIESSYQSRRISQFEEFFMVYDLHSRRVLEAWEFPTIFADALTKEDAEALIRGARTEQSGGMPYQTLSQELVKKVPYVTSNPSAVPRESVFATKFKPQNIQQSLTSILSAFKQRSPMPFQDSFGSFFSRNYIDKVEFTRFLSATLRIQNDVDQLFQYFQLAGENMLQKITFIQALKQLDTAPQQMGLQQPFQTPQPFQNQQQTPQPFQNQQQPFANQTSQQQSFQNNYQNAQTYGGQQSSNQYGNQSQQAFGGQASQYQTSQPIANQQNSYQQQQPSQSQNNMPNQLSNQVWDEIRKALEQCRIKDLRRDAGLILSTYNGRFVVAFEQFLAFLRMLLRFDQAQAFQITQAFLIQVSQQQQQSFVVDIEAFEQQLYNQSPTQTSNHLMSSSMYQQQRSSYETVSKIYDQIRRYVIVNDGDIMRFFQDADTDRNNYVSKVEFRMVMQKIGFKGTMELQEAELVNVFSLFDEDRDGRISYSELCKQFAEFSNTKAIKDPKHWAYYIFENIRRTQNSSQKNLAQIFGINNIQQFKSWDDKITFSRDQFLRSLSQMGVPLSIDHERQLTDMLRSNNNQEIDFILLSELVGMKFQTNDSQMIAKQMIPLSINLAAASRRFFRQLFQILESQGMLVVNLSAIFKSAEMLMQQQGYANQSTKGALQMNEFVNRLQSLSMANQLDANSIREIASRFPQAGQQQMVNYEEFMRTVTFEFDKYKLIDVIFTTLQAALAKSQMQTLRELFARVQPASQQNFNQPSVDRQALESVLRAAGGVTLKPWELDMIVMEYESSSTGSSTTNKLDFDAFDREFRDFQQGKSQLNMNVKSNTTANDFRSYVGNNNSQAPSQTAVQSKIIKNQSPQVKESLRRVATLLTQDRSIKVTDVLQRYQAGITGAMTIKNFENMLLTVWQLRFDEAGHLLVFYDPTGRQEVRIQEFLNDLAEEVDGPQKFERRMELINASTSIGGNVQSADGNQNLLSSYSKDFEEMFKALYVRGGDAMQWFSAYSQQPGKQTLDRRDLGTSLQSLNLSREFTMNDLDNIFAALDNRRSGYISITQLDETMRKFIGTKNLSQLQDDVVERIARAFNGDDMYLMRELLKLDNTGRGMVESSQFANSLRTNSPSSYQLSPNDLLFLAKKYSNKSLNSNVIDVNLFISDIRITITRVRIPQGVFSVMMEQPGAKRQDPSQVTSGHINPLLGTGVRNTKTELLRQVKDIERTNFQISIADTYFEDLVKGTYIKGQTVYEYFLGFAQTQTQKGETLQSSDFNKAISALGIGWTMNSTENVFTQIDTKMNEGRRQMNISAIQVDEVVCLGCKKSITELQDDVIKQIVKQSVDKNHDVKSLLTQQDIAKQKLISVDSFCDVVLNKMQVPSMGKPDLLFLARRYIQTLPNYIQYEKLLDDMNFIQKSSFSNVANNKSICSYVRKACLAVQNVTEPELYFKTCIFANVKEQLLILPEFIKGCKSLGLIPDVCTESQIQQLFQDMDTAKTQKLTLDQISSYIKKASIKNTRELQDEIIDEISVKVRASNFQLEILFRGDDPRDRGLIAATSFNTILQKAYQVKEIDLKVLSLRYVERGAGTVQSSIGEINYKKFISEVQAKNTSATLPQKNLAGGPNVLSAGLYNQDPNSDIGLRLKQLLIKVNTYITQTKISLLNQLSPYEIPGGFVPQDQFITVLKAQMMPISDEDYRFLSENYLTKTPARAIDYRKFLSDIKLHGGESAKQQISLTQEQQKIYTQLSKDLRTKQKLGSFAQSFTELDPTMRGYLSQAAITELFKKNGYPFDRTQLGAIISALDSNASGEYNYKQLLELTLGAEDTQKFFAGGAIGGMQTQTQQLSFVMPQQPLGAKSAILDGIGKKFIQSGKNYEEEFKMRIGEKQATAQSPKASDSEIEAVLANCAIKLSNDERVTLQALISSSKDQMGFVPVMELLQAIGLPPQTLGFRGQKQLPKRILTDKDRKYAQDLIIKMRAQLTSVKKKPEDIFEKCKADSRDISIPEFRFRMVLTQQADFGAFGRQITEDQVKLLVYYLSQEVPGEISYKKLYLACTQTEKDQPLSQEGADEIRRYDTVLREQAKKGTPLELVELFHFMKQNSLTIAAIFKNTQKGIITRQDFENALREVGFKPRDMLKLIEALDPKGTRTTVNLDKLQDYMSKSSSDGRNVTPQIARDRFQGFDPKVRQTLQRISEFLKKNNITLNKLYDMMDHNKDGVVDRDEFVTTLPQIMQIPGVEMRDYAIIFTALDINNDGKLSLNEFGLFIEGAKVEKMQRMQDIDRKLLDDMAREITILFRQFDLNGDGFVEADEIQRSMLSLGQRLTIEDARQMIKQVDTTGDGKIDQKEFQEMMLKQMKEELLSQEDNVEDLKAKFLDADIDHSGTLTIDEIFSVLLRLGAELTIDELVELMNEIDVDRNGTLDIDEFIALMTTTGDEIQFESAGAKNTLMNIKRARRLNPLDFFKNFKMMPSNFVPSFFAERWGKKLNLPSTVFMPQIDPKTMLYKDIMPVLQENIPPNAVGQKPFHPRVRPIPIELGCQLLFDEAQGVPLPQTSEQFDRSQIVKRALRVGLFDTVRKEYISNSVQVNALYNIESAEDVWQFQAIKDNGLNPILFKVGNKDEIMKPNIFMVFEFVIYVRFSGSSSSESQRIVEMSCGWCQLELANAETLTRQMTHKLAIKGGCPNAEILIKDGDVHTNRTGIKYSLMRVVQSKIQSQLTVELRPHVKFSDETKFHMELLPQTCFIQERLLYFVSGFRNYLGEKFLKDGGPNGGQSSLLTFKKPEGDAIITSFAKILDCPDIVEILAPIWAEDVLNTLNSKQKVNIEHIILKTKEVIRKLYPVLYAEEFQFKESSSTQSAAGDQYLMRKREDLIRSALRYGNPQAKVKVDRPIESMTTFKPFTVRELDFEVWDSSQAKNDRFLQQYEELGLIKNTSVAAKQPLQQPVGAQQTSMMNRNAPVTQQYVAPQNAQSWDLGGSLNKQFGN